MRNLVLLLLLVNGTMYGQPAQDEFSFPAPDSIEKLAQIKLWSTQYYIHEFTSGGSIAIKDQDGDPTGLFADTCDFCKASLEGTAFVKDSTGKITVINFASTGKGSQVDCKACSSFKKSKLNTDSWGKTLWSISSGYGNGVLNYKLVPFRTIAVDPAVIPYGTVLYVAEADGIQITLPGGTMVVHDGYFFAGDTGGAIKKDHIDTFTGVFTGNPFPQMITSLPGGKFTARIVTDQHIIRALTDLHLHGSGS